jgi:dienelactone hydrolase
VRRWCGLGVGGICGIGGIAIVIALVFQVERDPTASFLARRSRLVAAVLQSRTPTVERLRLRAASGLAVELAVKRPVEDLPRRRPLVVLLGGFETGRDAVDLVADPRGVVLAALSYPYPGPPPAHGVRGVLALPQLRAAILDTPPAVLLALDYLLQQPYVDGRRVELVGVSLGAPFAVVAGALDPRFRRVWSVHGAGDLPLLIDTALRGSLPFAPLRRGVAQIGYVLAAGPAVAPERWAGRIAPRPFLMLNAQGDERMPRRAILALYKQAREPKELLWVPGPHVEPDRRAVVEGLIGRVLGRILSDDASGGPRGPR